MQFRPSHKQKHGPVLCQLLCTAAAAERGPSLRYSAPGFLQKSDPYVLVTLELGQKILNFYGLALKIAILYFLALSPALLKNVKRYRRRR
jgi:hypothetical protein